MYIYIKICIYIYMCLYICICHVWQVTIPGVAGRKYVFLSSSSLKGAVACAEPLEFLRADVALCTLCREGERDGGEEVRGGVRAREGCVCINTWPSNLIIPNLTIPDHNLT
jgi:hypothetical protein